MINFNSNFSDLNDSSYLTNPIQFIKTERYRNTIANFGEQLLLFDKISLKIERDNLALAILINELGINNVTELIEQGIIEFLIWTPMVVVGQGKNGEGVRNEVLLKGTPPIVTGVYGSDIHIDPNASATNALNFVLQQSFVRKERRSFVRKVAKATKVTDFTFTNDASKIVISTYENNELKELGLPFNLPAFDLSYQDRIKLQSLASDVLETSILAKYKYSSLNHYSYSTIAAESLKRIQQAHKLEKDFQKIITIENLLDLRKYILDNNLSLAQILDIRKMRDSKLFREWLKSVSTNENAVEITREYLDAIESRKGFFDSYAGKLTRTISLLSVSYAGDTLLFNGIPFMSGAIGLFDSYILSGLLQGWNPRLGIKAIEGKIKENSN